MNHGINRTSFVAYILLLTLGWMQFYASVREQFNGVSELKKELKNVREDEHQHSLRFALEREQFLEFRQRIATLMPDALKTHGEGLPGYAYRGLASTITKTESDMVRATVAKTLFERGKQYFADKKYAQAMKVFRQVIDRFSFSPDVPEAYFLLAESHFQENELEECTRAIQQMIELFPSHELTGFAMIRMGRILETQKRNEEAVDIYKTVLRSFASQDVANQAKASLRGLDL